MGRLLGEKRSAELEFKERRAGALPSLRLCGRGS